MLYLCIFGYLDGIIACYYYLNIETKEAHLSHENLLGAPLKIKKKTIWNYKFNFSSHKLKYRNKKPAHFFKHLS